VQLLNSKLEPFKVYFWENDKEIRGYKTYTSKDLNQIIESVNKIKHNLKPEEKITFIYSNEKESLYKELKDAFGDLIVGKSIVNAQGQEGNYYIIDFNDSTKKSDERLKKEFYTAVTRGKIGGIIINNDESLIIKNIQREASELQYISDKDVKKTNDKRLEILDFIFNEEDLNLQYTPITKVDVDNSASVGEEVSDEEGIGPDVETSPTVLPEGFFNSKEEAEKIDLTMYKPGFILLDENDATVGTIVGA
jgi:hypothetical protein